MRDALRVVKFTVRGYWAEFVWLALLNLLWSLALILPAAPFFLLPNADLFVILVLAVLCLLPWFVVSGALYFVANQVSRAQTVSGGTFVAGLRRYWAKSLAVGLINLVVAGLLVVNLVFYGAMLQGSWTVFAVIAWLVVAVYWLLVQVFWFPMILEMEDERVLLALRNAVGLVFITPGFSLAMAVLIFLFGALFIVLSVPAVVFMASFFLLMFNHATRSRLAHVREESYQPDAIDQDYFPDSR